MLRRAVATAYVASLRPAARRFEAALRDPEAAQAQRWRAAMQAASGSSYAQEVGLERIRDVRQFQDRVPIVDARGLDPWLHRVAAGESGVLASAPVLRVERTGGTRGQARLLPITAAYLEEVRAATDPWIHDLHRGDPRLVGLASYWSISPAGQGPNATPAGVPIGATDDTEYFGPLARWAIRQLLAVPPGVQGQELPAWRRDTARHLVACERLGLLSVWSPTFLALLMEAIEEELPAILPELPGARRRAIAQRLQDGAALGPALWPRLRLISCWTDGASAGLSASLRRHFPGTPIQGKGLLATEGTVSVPLGGAAAPVLAVASHFLEFVDEERPDARPRLAHELEPGRTYTLLLTTSAGLVRYHLRDRVRCEGRLHATPTVRFLGRADGTSDLCGEKLEEDQVQQAIESATQGRAAPSFAMLAPELDPPRYRLFLEGVGPEEAQRIAAAVDAALQEAHPYRHCRELGQLGPVQAVGVQRGWARFMEARMAAGARLGDVKPVALDPRPGWSAALAGVAA